MTLPPLQKVKGALSNSQELSKLPPELGSTPPFLPRTHLDEPSRETTRSVRLPTAQLRCAGLSPPRLCSRLQNGAWSLYVVNGLSLGLALPSRA